MCWSVFSNVMFVSTRSNAANDCAWVCPYFVMIFASKTMPFDVSMPSQTPTDDARGRCDTIFDQMFWFARNYLRHFLIILLKSFGSIALSDDCSSVAFA